MHRVERVLKIPRYKVKTSKVRNFLLTIFKSRGEKMCVQLSGDEQPCLEIYNKSITSCFFVVSTFV